MTPLALLTALVAFQADKFPPFTAGASDVTFEKSPPQSDADEMKARFHSKEDPGPWDVSKEKFRILVPKSYTHTARWGLFVYVNADNSANLPGRYEAILEKHKLLGITAYRSGNDRNIFERFRLAIDGNFNMCQRFNIDPDRVYVSGISGGGRTASMVAVAYADIFSGAIPFCGVNFYTPIPGEPGKAWPPGYIPCEPALKMAKSNGRYVLVTGEKDMNLKETRAVYEYGFKKEGFKHALLMEVPGMGHSPPPAESFDKGLDFLDKPPK
ncbi:MAG TPA: PHB depolymerase family esterase [Planctomycetota bacterium]|nr:PHB depolymerase family esterase [Planctomycetota bacterium]